MFNNQLSIFNAQYENAGVFLLNIEY